MTIGEQIQLNNHGKKIDHFMKEGNFFEAVKSGNRNETRKYANQVDVNMKDSDGWTALMYATDTDDRKMISLLIELGADVNIQDEDGQTALMNAIFVNATNSAKFLIKHGANINVKDNNGQTPLMIAALSNEPEIGELLILKGANVYAVDNYGYDAFSIARQKWSFKKNDYFLCTRPIQKEINIRRIIYCFDLSVSLNNKDDTYPLQAFKDLFVSKYGYDVNIAEIELALEKINKNYKDKFLKVIILKDKFILAEEQNVYVIQKVEIVEGRKLNSTWKNKMQIIYTDRGKYIDNIPNDQFGFFSTACPGFDWKKFEGQKIYMSNIKIFRSRGYNWINYQR